MPIRFTPEWRSGHAFLKRARSASVVGMDTQTIPGKPCGWYPVRTGLPGMVFESFSGSSVSPPVAFPRFPVSFLAAWRKRWTTRTESHPFRAHRRCLVIPHDPHREPLWLREAWTWRTQTVKPTLANLFPGRLGRSRTYEAILVEKLMVR